MHSLLEKIKTIFCAEYFLINDGVVYLFFTENIIINTKPNHNQTAKTGSKNREQRKQKRNVFKNAVLSFFVASPRAQKYNAYSQQPCPDNKINIMASVVKASSVAAHQRHRR